MRWSQSSLVVCVVITTPIPLPFPSQHLFLNLWSCLCALSHFWSLEKFKIPIGPRILGSLIVQIMAFLKIDRRRKGIIEGLSENIMGMRKGNIMVISLFHNYKIVE